MLTAWDDATGDGLALTGERTLPGIAHENYWFRRHERAYQWAGGHARGTVVDAGCGEGYGLPALAGPGRRVLGLDGDSPAVRNAARRYRSGRVAAAQANLAGLPLAAGTVDTVVCLQVVEHLWRPAAFLAGCRRALRPGGRLVLSTPNRLTFSPGLEGPRDVFHAREYAPAELDALLASAGLHAVWSGCLLPGPRLAAQEAVHGPLPERMLAAGDPAGWGDELHADVAAVRADDFVVADGDRSVGLDLLAVAAP